MELSDFGYIVQTEWYWSELMRPEPVLDAFVIMPNHIHGIVGFERGVGAKCIAPLRGRQRQPDSLASVLGGIKSTITRQINAVRGTPSVSVWQRNYYERVIRGEEKLQAIREYIFLNPLGWDEDSEKPYGRRVFPSRVIIGP